MHSKQILRLALSIFVFGPLLFSCTEDPTPVPLKKTEQAPIEKISQDTVVPKTPETIQISGEVGLEQSAKIQFEIAGLLEAGELPLQTGTTFRKNQLLFQLNNAAAFRALNISRQQLVKQLQALLPTIQKDLPAELDKWKLFVQALRPENLIPDFPQLNSTAEQQFVSDQKLNTQHEALVQMQTNMRQHFYLAPFDGSVEKMLVQPGQNTTPGQPIAWLSEKGKYIWTASVGDSHTQLLRAHAKLDFRNQKGEMVATGKLIRSSQANQLRYRISPKNNSQISSGDIFTATIPAH